MNIFGDTFGDIFDFNGDGSSDLGEQWLGYKIFEEITSEEDVSDEDIDIEADDFDFTDVSEW